MTPYFMPERGIPPDGYREVLYWRITENTTRIVILQLLALPLLIVWGLIFYWLAMRFGKLPSSIISSAVVRVMFALAGIMLTILLHEAVHGITMQLFGARPRYGVMWKYGMFYATAPGYAFPRKEYLIVAIAPLISLSLLAVLGMVLLSGSTVVGLLALCATVNAAGAVGDLWIMGIVLRYPSATYIVDEQDGVRIFLPAY